MKIKKYKITNYGNAVEVRRHNRRILVKEYPLNPNDYVIETAIVYNDNDHRPASRHINLRGKVRVTGIRFTRIGMEDICTAFAILRDNQRL